MKNKIISLAAAAIMLFLPLVRITAFASDSDSGCIYTSELLGYAADIVSYQKNILGIDDEDSLFSGDFLTQAGEDYTDWFVIAISRMGLHEDYLAYYSALEVNLCEKFGSDSTAVQKTTEWDRAILTVLSCGRDPTDFNSLNLIEEGICGEDVRDSLGAQGVNGWIWALLALDSLCWKTSEDSTVSREYIVEQILAAQHTDGGFSLSEDKSADSDPDITAMALQSLAPYCYDGYTDKAFNAVTKGLEFLSEIQQSDGDYASCETTAQVLCTLCSLGIDFTKDERFIKKKNVYEALLDYRCGDGGFSHQKGGESDCLSSAQALLAIAAVARENLTLRRLYDFREEFSVPDRERLDAINSRISSISDEEEANHLNYLCQTLSADMQGYIRSYGNLMEAAQQYQLSLCQTNFFEQMNENESGEGCIYDIENTQIYTPSTQLTEADTEKYERLASGDISSSDVIICMSLSEKVSGCEEITEEEKTQMLETLEECLAKAQHSLDEINDINSIIMDELYPFENLSKEQCETAEKLYQRAQQLSDKDKEKITGYESLCEYGEKAQAKNDDIWLYGLFAAVLLTLAVIFAVKRRTRNG